MGGLKDAANRRKESREIVKPKPDKQRNNLVPKTETTDNAKPHVTISDDSYLDRGNSKIRFKENPDGTKKVLKEINLGTKSANKNYANEEIKRAKSLKERFPDTPVPIMIIDKNGNVSLETPYLEKVSINSQLTKDQKTELDDFYRKLGEKGVTMGDAKANTYRDSNGKLVLKDLTHIELTPLTPGIIYDENYHETITDQKAELIEEIKRVGKKWFDNDTSKLEEQLRAIEEQERHIELEKNRKDLEVEESKEKEGTWIFTAVLKNNFPEVFEKFGPEVVKNNLVKDLYAINMLIITQIMNYDDSNTSKFVKLLYPDINVMLIKLGYKNLRERYIKLHSQKRADIISNTPILKDEILTGLMSILCSINLVNPNYFSPSIKEMLRLYTVSDKSLKYVQNVIKLIESADSKNNIYLKMINKRK